MVRYDTVNCPVTQSVPQLVAVGGFPNWRAALEFGVTRGNLLGRETEVVEACFHCQWEALGTCFPYHRESRGRGQMDDMASEFRVCFLEFNNEGDCIRLERLGTGVEKSGVLPRVGIRNVERRIFEFGVEQKNTGRLLQMGSVISPCQAQGSYLKRPHGWVKIGLLYTGELLGANVITEIARWERESYIHTTLH